SRLHDELAALAAAGATDVVLYPCSADIGQVELVAAALAEARLEPHAERQPSVSGEESVLSNVRHTERGRGKEAS
ncbi:MAG TPA: hypothetical protein VGU26_09125, partial [Gaiellaceae bacterium]|nr:hypothetical protein [Gaiellaceae bacterium]